MCQMAQNPPISLSLSPLTRSLFPLSRPFSFDPPSATDDCYSLAWYPPRRQMTLSPFEGRRVNKHHLKPRLIRVSKTNVSVVPASFWGNLIPWTQLDERNNLVQVLLLETSSFSGELRLLCGFSVIFGPNESKY